MEQPAQPKNAHNETHKSFDTNTGSRSQDQQWETSYGFDTMFDKTGYFHIGQTP
jgi:hypothetical protein